MRLHGALLGAGNICLGSHAPQWTSNPALRSQVEIVAVADLSPLNLERARELLPGVRTYAEAEVLLEKETLDLCDICTPPFTHAALVSQAALGGVHVMCEKPLAPSVAEAERIVSAVEHSGIVFHPCHQYHFAPQWQVLRKLLPRIGDVYLAEYEVERTAANLGNANWSPTWRTDPALAGGGILADHGAHIFYQLRSILGEPEKVQATVRTLRHHDYQVEDTAYVMLDYGSCLAQVRLSWAARRRGIRFRFVGEHGEISGDDNRLWLNADSHEEVGFDSGLSRDSSHAEWYAPLFARFLERVRSGERDYDALHEAAHVTRLIARAYQSSVEGRALPLAPVAEVVASRAAAVVADQAEEGYGLSLRLDADPAAAAEQDSRAPSGSTRRRTLLSRGAAAAVLVASVTWSFHDVRAAAVWSSVSAVRPGWLAVACAVNLLVVLFQSARWLALIRPLSPRVRLDHALRSTLIGYAVSAVVPARAGELARIEWLGRYTGLSRLSLLGSVLLDQLVNASWLLVGVALLPLFVGVPFWMRQSGWFALTLFLVGVVLVVALRRVVSPPNSGRPERLDRLTLRTVSSALIRVQRGLVACSEAKALGYSLAASLAAWGLEINVTALSMRAAGLHLPIAASIVVLIAVNLALALPFAPGNLGTLELGATLALLEFGIRKEQALAFALCYHSLQVIPIVIMGFLLVSRGFPEQGARQAA